MTAYLETTADGGTLGYPTFGRVNGGLACATVFIAFAIPNRYAIGAQGFTLDIPTILGILAAIGWLTSVTLTSVTVERLNPVRSAMILYALYVLASVGVAYSRVLTDDEARGVLRSVAGIVGVAGVVLMILDGLRKREQLVHLVAWAVGGGALSATVAIGQKLFGFGYAAWWGSVPGLGRATTTAPLEALASGRTLGTANHPIELSVASAVLIPLALAGASYGGSRRSRRWYLFATAVLAVGAFLAVSRSGFIAMVLIGLLILNRARPRRALNILGAFVGVLALLQVFAHGTLSTLRYQLLHIGSDSSSKGRTADYGPVFDLVRQSPWFGRGYGTYIPDQYLFLDNAWLGQLVGGGVIGVVGLALLMSVSLYAAGTVTHSNADPVLVEITRASAYAVLALAVSAYFFDELAFAQTKLLLFVFIGIIGAAWGMTPLRQRAAAKAR